MLEVSAIIPSYNRRQLIDRALDSVMTQTRQANEIIVVDDGSTDGAYKFVANNYPDIRYLNQTNKGINAARNRVTVINAARKDWLALLDSDDEWMPEKLKK